MRGSLAVAPENVKELMIKEGGLLGGTKKQLGTLSDTWTFIWDAKFDKIFNKVE